MVYFLKIATEWRFRSLSRQDVCYEIIKYIFDASQYIYSVLFKCLFYNLNNNNYLDGRELWAMSIERQWFAIHKNEWEHKFWQCFRYTRRPPWRLRTPCWILGSYSEKFGATQLTLDRMEFQISALQNIFLAALFRSL